MPTRTHRPLRSKTAACGTGEKPLDQKSPAQWAYERLVLYIQNFEEQLDDEHEVVVGYAGGRAGGLRIEGIGYFDPDIVTFYGRDEFGAKTQLIQHVTQLGVTLRAMPKQVSARRAKRIGFRLAEKLGKWLSAALQRGDGAVTGACKSTKSAQRIRSYRTANGQTRTWFDGNIQSGKNVFGFVSI